jgi:hypothetical protein
MTRHRVSRSARRPTLFRPEELAVRPSPEARLRRLAASAPVTGFPVSKREEDFETISRLRRWGGELAVHFGLRFKAIDPERDGVVEHYGICFEDGLIRIRLRHAKSGKLLKESSLVDTLCHELAHLKHMDHSIRFRRFYAKILARARKLGYYRPGPGDVRKPRQLTLFDPEGCGTASRATSRSQK